MIDNITAIITARGGSKRLPGKNIMLFNGKPLIAWTIEAALKSKSISHCWVTTDSSMILTVSGDYGASVIQRPAELARDNTKSEPVIIHALEYLKHADKLTDWCMLLQPTSPLRNSQHIDSFTHDFSDIIYNSAISYNTITDKPNGAMYLFKSELFLKYKKFDIEPCEKWWMFEDDSIDINTLEDFERAEKCINI